MRQTFFLGRGDMLALTQGAGTTVAVGGGEVWITQHGDINDYAVREGAWQARQDGLVLIHALQQCRIGLTGPARARLQLRRRGNGDTCASPITGRLPALRRWFSRPLLRS